MKTGNDEPIRVPHKAAPKGRLHWASGLLVTLALLLYPILVYAGLSTLGIGITAPLLLAVFAIRLLQARPRKRALFHATAAIPITGAILVTISWILARADWLLYYPVAISIVLLLLFSFSLYRPPSIVERIARLTTPDLQPEAVRYTRKVTQVWCAFFVFNATIALLTCLHGDLRLWTLYNGAISYALMGSLMAIEWIIRRCVQKRIQSTSASTA